jgi:hypothetical protein
MKWALLLRARALLRPVNEDKEAQPAQTDVKKEEAKPVEAAKKPETKKPMPKK